MAGTCNDCGADTWGRYRICPDCRRDRKRKGKRHHRNYMSNRRYSISPGERYACNNCGYLWRTKKDFGDPSQCPKCRDKNITLYANTPEGIERKKADQQLMYDHYLRMQRERKIRNTAILIIVGLILIYYFLYIPFEEKREEKQKLIDEELQEQQRQIELEQNIPKVNETCRTEFNNRLNTDFYSQEEFIGNIEFNLFETNQEANNWIDLDTDLRKDKSKDYFERIYPMSRYSIVTKKISKAQSPVIIITGDFDGKELNNDKIDEVCGLNGFMELSAKERGEIDYMIFDKAWL